MCVCICICLFGFVEGVFESLAMVKFESTQCHQTVTVLPQFDSAATVGRGRTIGARYR